ncbi:MAG TPA: hypothetical protein VGZ47_07685 [Gemmataceae bacterium]|jgi:hypothetical protein|nr:hypothetical protein [Gemmataceae bacterium]
MRCTFLTSSALLAIFALAASADDKTLFDPDPDHVVNRMHRHLYWQNANAGINEQDRLEPVPILDSPFLLDGHSPRQAIELLDAFLALKPEQRPKDPLKRAILQHDLWAVFAETTGQAQPRIIEQADGRMLNSQVFIDLGDHDLKRKKERRELQKRLVQAMREVALTEKEINALPDNLTEIVKSGTFAKDHDPKQPAKPFLPPDLLSKAGPWIAVSNSTQVDGLAAPTHLATFKARSLFSVFIRLPGGRKETEAFVKKLSAGQLPPLPEGTQTALLRRMFLIDDRGHLQPTALTESVQFRVYEGDHDTGQPYAFKLQRAEFISGQGNVLQPMNAKDFSCIACHARIEGNGVRSIASLYVGNRRQPGLDISSIEEQTNRSMEWTKKSYSWGLLQGLWENER